MNDPAIARGAIALASGSLFGLGLALAGMTRVEKVRGFPMSPAAGTRRCSS